MDATNLTAAQHEHAESHVKTYLKVFVVLLIFTILEYFYAKFASRYQFHIALLILGLMVLAIVKATLVAMYFMHLKFETRTLGLIAITPLLIATLLVFIILPDSFYVNHKTANLKPATSAPAKH
jgi:cytochrome c oxidase subunit IV